MAFLDNSGDIILDAVLTDTGRFRLAKGDGSFKVVKFALGDDEINYRIYNKNHASGSAYYDLEILQSPVFEAFTNNTATMNSKLLSIPRTNLLYLPIIKFNDKTIVNSKRNSNNNGYAVAVTKETFKKLTNTAEARVGWLDGENPETSADNIIRLDQGLDTTEISWQFDLDQDLKETQYIVEIDNRLGTIATPVAPFGNAPISFIDDDNVASYYFSMNDPDYVMDTKVAAGWSNNTNNVRNDVQSIDGPQGTCLTFKIRSSLELISSDFLFDQLGAVLPAAGATGGEDAWSLDNTKAYKYIDAVIKVTGATTGYRIDVPVRFIKCTDC